MLKWQQKGTIGVVRGKKGVTQTISINKLVVGDVIVLEPGCIIPADCLLLEGNDVTVDEKFFNDNEKAFKSVVVEGQHHGKDPFLFSSSIVLNGSGRALVCSVGANSNRPKSVFDTEAKTAL